MSDCGRYLGNYSSFQWVVLWVDLYTARVSLTDAAICVDLKWVFVQHSDFVRCYLVNVIFYCANTTAFHMHDLRFSEGGRQVNFGYKMGRCMQWHSQPKNLGGVKQFFWGQNVWFYANNTILLGKTPLKTQNDYFLKIFGGAWPLWAPLATPIAAWKGLKTTALDDGGLVSFL